MGICFSCLRHDDSDDIERSHLLSSDDAYNATGFAYGGTSQGLATRHLNPEEAKREQEALENITRWTTDTVVDIFPHTALLQHNPPPHNADSNPAPSPSSSNVRVYPASRPSSQASRQASIRSKASSRLEASTRAPRIFRTLEIGEGD